MQTLQPNSSLQRGRYKILSILGQGGFGITYLAMQSGLERKVAIKEFFMKELCERDETETLQTLGTSGNVTMVNRFREKFLKEARNIARLNHPNIVRIIDVFEENGTAYYVMEYIENGSLAEKVKREGYLSEPVATRYILQVANALEYIHQQKMNHLDIKPANIMLNEKDEVVLIDFGLSKQYDAITGNQTSTTPVGVSEGYAPMELYKQGGVGEFSPETDIYALGATFFKLLTGTTPPSASDIYEDGVPVDELNAKGVSKNVIDVVCKAMEGRKKDRMKNAGSFMEDLCPGAKKNMMWIPITVIALIVIALVIYKCCRNKTIIAPDTSSVEKVADSIEIKEGDNGRAVFRNDTLIVNDSINYEFVRVNKGRFEMGATRKQSPYAVEKREAPTHYVTITNDYLIGKYEVTQDLWEAVMGNNPSSKKGERKPVDGISWNDAQAFIDTLNQLTGQHFRLPTEAEWEFAAKGGNLSQKYQYSGSDKYDEVAWLQENSASNIQDVGQKLPNELGLYDMSGNVYEWCQDWYGNYSKNDQNDPIGPSSGTGRIRRGGCVHSNSPKYCRVTFRMSNEPSKRFYYVGLRLAK